MRNYSFVIIGILALMPWHLSAQTAVSIFDNAPVLYAPSKTATRIHTLKFGVEKVTLTQETVQVQEDRLRTYVKVALMDGMTGWMNQYLLVQDGDGAVCTGNTGVYQNPVDGVTMFRNKEFVAGEPLVVLEMVDNYAHVIGKEKKKEGWIPTELVLWGNEEVRAALVLEQIMAEKNLQKRQKRLNEIRGHESYGYLQMSSIIEKEWLKNEDMIAMGYAYTTDVAPTAPVALADNTAPYMPEGRLRGDQQERALNPGDQVSIVAPQLIRKAEVLQIIEVVHENKSPKSAALECYHKTLPVGTIVQMLLPDNPGFIELKVIGNLQKNEGLGLPPGTIRRIFGDIIPPNVNVEYLATLK